MVWEKKIQIAKETQAAVDPNIGAVEITEMEQEIRRMHLRYSHLLKQQEKAIQDMEKAVYRHGEISEKASRAKTGQTLAGVSVHQQLLQKSIADLSKRLKKAQFDVQDADENMQRLTESQAQIAAHIQQTEAVLKQLTAREQKLKNEVDTKSNEREFNLNELISLQSRARRYAELKSGKYAFAVKDPEVRPLELEKQRLRAKQIVKIVQDLESDYGNIIRPTIKEVGLKGLASLAEKA